MKGRVLCWLALAAAAAACSGSRAATPAAPDRHPGPRLTREPHEPEPPSPDLTANVQSGCLSDCAGSPTPELVAALRVQAQDAKRCYDAALRRKPTLAGRIVIGLQITGEGAVCATRIVDRQIDDSELSQCIREIFQGMRYPAPTGGCVDVALPLNLVAKGDAGAPDGGP